jgi:hypothetical protein
MNFDIFSHSAYPDTDRTLIDHTNRIDLNILFYVHTNDGKAVAQPVSFSDVKLD